MSNIKQRQKTREILAAIDETPDVSFYIDSMTQVFQRTDRIISGDNDLTVTTVTQSTTEVPQNIAAYSTGSSIRINKSVVAQQVASAKDDDARRSVLRSVYGLNLHELCHSMLTPREDSAFVQRLEAHGKQAMEIANCLEDQRIESHFTALYEPSAAHFTRMLTHHVIEVQTPETLSAMHCLLWGRKFLPRDLRDRASKLFDSEYGSGAAATIASFIDEYRLLVLPEDTDRAVEIILEMRDFLASLHPKGDPNGNVDLPSDDHLSTQTEGETNDERSQQASEALSEELDEDEDDEDESQTSQSSESTEDDADEDESDESQTSQSSESTDDDSEASESDETDDSESADDASDQQSQPTDSDSRAENADDADDADEDDLLDALQEALAEAESATDAEISQLDRKIANEIARSKSEIAVGPKLVTTPRPVRAEIATMQRRVTRAFDEIRAQLEADWIQRESSGRLNSIAAMNRDHGDFDIFDRYDPGAEDASGVELVLLVDRSFSMQGVRMTEASEAAWVVRSAIHSLGGRCTVLAYDDEHHVVSHPDEKPSRHFFDDIQESQLNTNPTESLVEARRLLLNSEMPNKIVVVLTDGQWNGMGNYDNGAIVNTRNYYSESAKTIEPEAIIDQMNREGIVTSVFGIAEAVRNHGSHEARIAHDLTSAAQLPIAVKALVAESIRQTARDV